MGPPTGACTVCSRAGESCGAWMVRNTHWDSEALTAQEHCPAWSRGWRHGAGRVTRCNGSALLCSLWPRGSHTTWTCLVRDICSLSAIFSWSIPVLCHRTASNQAHICIKLMSDCKLDSLLQILSTIIKHLTLRTKLSWKECGARDWRAFFVCVFEFLGAILKQINKKSDMMEIINNNNAENNRTV